jgi:hypothetical protein
MLTLKLRRKRRVPPQRGRGEILGLFFCFPQSSTLAVGMSIGSAVLCLCDDCAQLRFRSLRAAPACYAWGSPGEVDKKTSQDRVQYYWRKNTMD